MNSSEWAKATNAGRFAIRSKTLKAVDAAFAVYEARPGKATLDALDSAVNTWRESLNKRTPAMDKALLDIKMLICQKRGEALRRAPVANIPRRIHNFFSTEKTVSVKASQTLTYPQSPFYDDYCNQYFRGNHSPVFPLNINFRIQRRATAFLVTVHALGHIDNALHPLGKSVVKDSVLSHWKTHCESTWNVAVLYVGQKKYDLIFELVWVQPGAPGPYYTITMHHPAPLANAAPTRQQVADNARSGTPHLEQWGIDDRQAIAHEFGHMIGNPDEYLCTSFSGLPVAWTPMYNGAAFTTKSIMNNTREDGCFVYERHFATVANEIEIFLGELDGRPSPRVRIAIEKPALRRALGSRPAVAIP